MSRKGIADGGRDIQAEQAPSNDGGKSLKSECASAICGGNERVRRLLIKRAGVYCEPVASTLSGRERTAAKLAGARAVDY